jgi:hypothetical protein
MLAQPAVNIIHVILFGPEHAGQGLAHNVTSILAYRRRSDGIVELIGFVFLVFDHL